MGYQQAGALLHGRAAEVGQINGTELKVFLDRIASGIVEDLLYFVFDFFLRTAQHIEALRTKLCLCVLETQHTPGQGRLDFVNPQLYVLAIILPGALVIGQVVEIRFAADSDNFRQHPRIKEIGGRGHFTDIVLIVQL